MSVVKLSKPLAVGSASNIPKGALVFEFESGNNYCVYDVLSDAENFLKNMPKAAKKGLIGLWYHRRDRVKWIKALEKSGWMDDAKIQILAVRSL